VRRPSFGAEQIFLGHFFLDGPPLSMVQPLDNRGAPPANPFAGQALPRRRLPRTVAMFPSEMFRDHVSPFGRYIWQRQIRPLLKVTVTVTLMYFRFVECAHCQVV